MKEESFTIGRTRKSVFTKDQLYKVRSGLDIFIKAVNTSSFGDAIKNYRWEDKEGISYDRFHLSKAFSNDQVYRCFQDLKWAFGANKKVTVAILPCDNRNDLISYSKMTTPTIWLNRGHLNHDWFTPVHVASCIAHEYCINLGFNTGISGYLVPLFNHTVPYACGIIIKDVLEQWKSKITDIRDSFDYIEMFEDYKYLPCSTTFQMKGMKAESESCNQKLKDIKKLLKKEIKALKNQNLLSQDEFDRLCALEKSIYDLKQIQLKLKETSLDGMDFIEVNPIANNVSDRS